MRGTKLFSILALSLLGVVLLLLLIQQPVSVDSLMTTGRVTSFGASSEGSVSAEGSASVSGGTSEAGSSSANVGSSDSVSGSSQSSSTGSNSVSAGSTSSAGSSSPSASATTKSASPNAVKPATQGAVAVKPGNPATSGASPSPAESSTTVASSAPSASAEEVRQFSVTRGGTIPAGEAIQATIEKYGLGSDAKVSYSAEDGSATVSGYRVGKLFGIIQVRVPMKASISQAGVEAKAPFWASFVR